MTSRLVVCITAPRTTVARWTGRSLSACEVFPSDEAGYTAFSRYLAGIKRMPVYIIVDAVEEDYRFETLPHSGGGDRAEMVGRKLKQMFRGTPYCSASYQGRDTGKRRDDRYLLSALTNPGLVTGWLQIIEAQKLPVASLALLPMVTHALIPKLGIKPPNFLLVSQHDFGFRLTFFRDRKLRISRLTRLEEVGAQSGVRSYCEEIANTRLYLHATRILTLEEPLTVIVLDRDDTLTSLPAEVAKETTSVQCLRLGRKEIATGLGVTPASLDGPAAFLYLHLLGSFTPPGNLAPAPLTESFGRLQLRRMVYAGTAIAATLCAVWAGARAYEIYDVNEQTLQAANNTAVYTKRYVDITRQYPAAPTSPENLQRAVEIAQQLKATTRTPEMMLGTVSRALNDSPRVTLKTFGWRYGTQEIDTEGAAPKAAGDPAAGGTATQPALFRKQSAVLEAEIRPFNGDYRAAIAEIHRFVERIQREAPVAEARVIKYPLNVNPGTSLVGSTLDDRAQHSTSAPFKLAIVFKPNT